MNNLSRIEIFLEVARRRSFARAAAALGITGPAASKQVMALEDALGVKLLHRTTRLVTLTDEGALFESRARVALDELKDAAAEIQDMKETPRGALRINAPLSFAHMHLLPVLSGFARRYPDVQLEVVLEDRKVDIVAEGFDMAIRIGTLTDSTLVSRRLGDCPLLLVGAPAYIKEHGAPKTPSDIKRHHMIAFTPIGTAQEWRWRGRGGKTGVVRYEGAFKANTAEMMVQAALDGIGLALIPAFAVTTYIEAGKLVRVLPAYDSYPMRDITALMPPNRYRSAKVQLLAEWITHACKAMPLTL